MREKWVHIKSHYDAGEKDWQSYVQSIKDIREEGAANLPGVSGEGIVCRGDFSRKVTFEPSVKRYLEIHGPSSVCRDQGRAWWWPRAGSGWIAGVLGAGSCGKSESHSVVSDSLQPHGLYSPWNSPGQNTGVGSRSLLQVIFPSQGLNPGLPHCRQILYQLSHQGSPSCRKAWPSFLRSASLLKGCVSGWAGTLVEGFWQDVCWSHWHFRENWGGAGQCGLKMGEEVAGRVASLRAPWLMTNWPGTRNF